MSKKPLPRIISGAVITMIAIAAFVTFTRGDSQAPDTASATVPGVTSSAGPVVEGSTTTPTPSASASADAIERNAKKAATKTSTKATPVRVVPTKSPTSSPPKDPDPTQAPPPSAPTTPAPNNCGLFVLLGCK